MRRRRSSAHRIAWITGAGKGLGRALALELAARGVTVAASARSEEDLARLAAEDSRIRPYPLDVTQETAVQAVRAAIEQDLGPIDLAVFNAGTHLPVRAEALTSAPFRTLVEVNLMGVVHGLAAVVPGFIARRRGHVVVTASVSGYRGLPTAAAYGATKAGLINLCEALKPDLERHGVAVSVVNPGFVRTPLTDRNDFPMPFLMEPDEAARRMADGIEAGRFEIVFPTRMALLMKLVSLLPSSLFFALTRRMVRQS
ncbi:SDR family NAD(P)-dependent oxidoreductase [Caenispirillum bisanense]|uniref:SDR family NAD(P)-dependent oxidoreductase n=1 Tax=Caenispirillum bisanense TaxID=414052 RepID=UPI0031D7CB1F